jgi:predicted DNA-binding protein
MTAETTTGTASSPERLAALRAHDDTTDLTAAVDGAEADDRVLADDEVMVSTSIRLPRSLMQRLRRRAADVGVPATTLMRQWILDRLDAHSEETVVSVADLQRFIAERAHPAA